MHRSRDVTTEPSAPDVGAASPPGERRGATGRSWAGGPETPIQEAVARRSLLLAGLTVLGVVLLALHLGRRLIEAVSSFQSSLISP
ncbi:MAG: hypothetical protein ACE5JR_04570 [Gemmatimonadota bacterium]